MAFLSNIKRIVDRRRGGAGLLDKGDRWPASYITGTKEWFLSGSFTVPYGKEGVPYCPFPMVWWCHCTQRDHQWALLESFLWGPVVWISSGSVLLAHLLFTLLLENFHRLGTVFSSIHLYVHATSCSVLRPSILTLVCFWAGDWRRFWYDLKILGRPLLVCQPQLHVLALSLVTSSISWGEKSRKQTFQRSSKEVFSLWITQNELVLKFNLMLMQ